MATNRIGYWSEFNNRPARRRYIQAWHRRKKYGITTEQLKALRKKQRNRCALCGRRLGRNFHVDHDHKTKKVRGLLCFHCNTGLGQFKDRIQLLKKAIRYLMKFK